MSGRHSWWRPVPNPLFIKILLRIEWGCLFAGKSVKIFLAVLTYVYASESMLWGCFVFKLGTKYPLKSKHRATLSSFPNAFNSTERRLWPSWWAAKYNLWLVLNWFVDFTKGPVKKNHPPSPNNDNSYIASVLKNSWTTVNLSWETFLKCLKIALSKKETGLKLLFGSSFWFSLCFVHFIFHWFFMLPRMYSIVFLIPGN